MMNGVTRPMFLRLGDELIVARREKSVLLGAKLLIVWRRARRGAVRSASLLVVDFDERTDLGEMSRAPAGSTAEVKY